MARSPASPGPPPPNYRPPGAPLPPPGSPTGFGEPAPWIEGYDQGRRSDEAGVGAAVVVAVAIVTLLVGAVVGFFVGRAVESDDTSFGAPPLTSPPTSSTVPPGDTIPQVPPVDPGAPPSTDLEPTSLGTLEDPIPAGQSYVLGLYEVEVRSVDRDAEAALQDAVPTNPPAPDDQKHVLVEVSLRFTEAQGIGNPGSVPFFLSDGNGRWDDVDARCGTVPDSILSAGLIEQGDEATGNACFTVPAAVVEDLRFGTEGFDGPVYFELP